MLIITDKIKCSGCSACANMCPHNCIEMQFDNEGFLYPKVNYGKCTNCGLCEKSCPIINPISANNTPKVYAAYNKNEEIRLNSSSGGIFTLIAEHVLRLDGVVFGACYNNKFEVVHSYTESIEGLEKFRGSKYVQSSIGNTYKKAKVFLDEGKVVFFTGTPCQIGGLLAYLRKNYDNLYTQDLICHGAPSPMVWGRYVKYREKCAGAPTQRTFFRNKKYGWKMYSVQFEFSNCTEYIKHLREDVFMKGFLSDLYLRPSCHKCSFKAEHRPSDITLADFWGIENVLPEMDDDKGTSVIMINSNKGRLLFNGVKDQMVLGGKEVDISTIKKYNPALVKSAIAHKNRRKFFHNINKYEFDELIKKYCVYTYGIRLKKFIYRLLSRIKSII